jgi:glycosyltransferase involved in cell wall biosynthesis
MLDSLRMRMRWEQRSLPAMANELGADLVHLSSANPALFTPKPYLLSPVDVEESSRHPGIYARLRQALSAGGMSRLAGLVWPSDLPAPSKEYPVFPVMPAPPFGWMAENEACPEDVLNLDLPDTYILYHGPCHQAALHFLLETFRWAAGPVGANYPLLILGLDEVGRERLPELLDAYDLSEYVRAVPVISTFSVPWLYRNCSVLFHPAEIAPWGNPLRNALAFGRPVVAAETALAGALVGPAAYLVALDQPRELGAALLSVLVEEELAGQLSAVALQRAAVWQAETFCRDLEEVYRVLSGGA